MAIRVNGELVPSRSVVTELVRLVKFYKEHLPEEELEENRDLLIRKAKDQAIGAKLLLDEARKAGMRVTEGEVSARRGLLVKEAGGEAEFEEMMDGQGLDEIELQQSIVDSLMIDKFVRALVSRIPEPTHEEVHAFRENLREKGRTASEQQVQDLLSHEKKGRVISECVALLRKKAVIEDDDDLDGADIDALFDSYLETSENIDEPEEE